LLWPIAIVFLWQAKHIAYRHRNIDTNGKLLMAKADEIVDNLETISVSINCQ